MMRAFVQGLAVLVLAGFAFSQAARAGDNPSAAANFTGDIAINYALQTDGSVWPHLYAIKTIDPKTGVFSGTGEFVPDGSYAEIITGKLAGNKISFHVVYTGTNAGYYADAVGTIDQNGRLSGTATSPGQILTWVGVRPQPAVCPPVAAAPAPAAYEYEPVAPAPRSLALAGSYAIDYTLLADGSIWSHRYTIDSMDLATGEFSGIGHGVPDASYVEILTGRLVGNDISFHIFYIGTNAGYFADAVGKIDQYGHLSGTATSPGQSLTFTCTSGQVVQGP